MEIRSFLAFELPNAIKGEISRVSKDLRQSRINAKWVKIENIHLTVIFMGNISLNDMDSIKGEVNKSCMESGTFDVSLKGMGCFPGPKNPRVLWLGLDGDFEKMTIFRDKLQKSLLKFGIKQEKRPFRPHLTLGRFRKKVSDRSVLQDCIYSYNDLKSPAFSLKELILFKSELKTGGAVYTKLAIFPLKG